MAGLSNFISNEAVQSTSMPSWFDTAQQNVVNQATTAAGNVPSLQNTVAGQAINQLSGSQNPFTQAQGTLNQIASGAANPWLVSDTGQVTPNVATPLGGLFQAQNQQLEQLMPNITAPVQGASIGSGQFGSLRGQTAVNKAMADAQSKMFADQMNAALQAQGVGAQAAGALGQVGSQGVQSMTSLVQAQQSDPFFASSALGKILGGMQIPTTTKNVTNLSPLNQIGSIVSALGGSISGTDKMLKDLGLGGLSKYLKAAGSGSYAGSGLGAGLGAGTYTLADGGTMTIGADGNRVINNTDGTYQTYDKDGNLLGSGRTDQYADTDTDLGGGDTGGGSVDIDTGGGGGSDFNWDTYEPSNPYEGYSNIENSNEI
jgi:hypothetical protein